MANVRVAVRVRPLSGKEVDASARNIVTTHGNSLSITNVKVEGVPEYGDSRDRVKHFAFDFCYDSAAGGTAVAEYASQELVYQDMGTEVLQAAFDGYNACLFAYGQTGTGKTFTMMGHPGDVGLTPRICEGLFSHVDDCPEESITFRVEISYMEIYNERVRDLLRGSSHPERFTLRVREHPKDGPYVQDLSRHPVKDFHEIQTLLDRGNQLRTTAATHMHEHSSRSHAIVTVNFTQAKLEDGMPSETVSKVHLVDLAGSERADPTYHAAYKGRIIEGSNINKSLVTLGNVIKALAEKSLLAWSTETMGSSQSFASLTDGSVGSPTQGGGRRARQLYIPYRDSVLTWLLKDSLGGNSKTLMIATITPASNYYNETISTLRYAQRAKSIVNKPRINEDPNVALIRQLKDENERLRQMLASARMQSPTHSEVLYLLPGGVDRFLSYSSEHLHLEDEAGAVVSGHDSGAILSEKLKENEAFANQLTQTWLEKWNETHSLMKDTDLSIRGLGLGRRSSSYGVIIDSQLPHLIGMDDDILSTGVIIFHLQEGKTLVGREEARCEQDIVLSGPGILAEHCHIMNEDGQVVLYPHHGAQCTVNGVPVHEPTPLTQGDVLLFGKTHMYRFNNPEQAAKLRQHRKSLHEGELSSASSIASIPETEAARVAPLLMFNPNLDLEHTYPSETERIQQARRELDRLRGELRVREEDRQEEEERLWEEHERHRTELEAERIRLAAQVERLQMSEQEAQESLMHQQQELQEKEESYKRHLRQKLEQLTNSKGSDSTVQTDPLQRSSLSIQTDQAAANATTGTSDDVSISGPVGQEIRQRKRSVEGQVKGLAQSELLHTLNLRQATLELKQREEEMEEELYQSHSEIENRLLKIREMEELYRGADAAKLEQIQEKNQELEELQRQEEQLELYLEEKTDLMAVGQAQPRHLRGACSELTLALPDSGGESFGSMRASSEANIVDHGDEGLMMEVSGSESMMTDSRGSLDDDSDLMDSAGFHPSGRDGAGFDRSQSLDSADFSESMDSADMLNCSAPDNLTYSMESDLNLEVEHGEAGGEGSHAGSAQATVEGRGRGRVRTARGRTRPIQGQGQNRPEVMEDKKLTSRAAQVTARLYQTPSPRPDLEGKFLRSKREKDLGSPSSYSPSSRRSPSSQASSASSSPVHTRAKRSSEDSPVLARRHGVSSRQARLSSDPTKHSRSELDRPAKSSKRSKSERYSDLKSHTGQKSKPDVTKKRPGQSAGPQEDTGDKPQRPGGRRGQSGKDGGDKDDRSKGEKKTPSKVSRTAGAAHPTSAGKDSQRRTPRARDHSSRDHQGHSSSGEPRDAPLSLSKGRARTGDHTSARVPPPRGLLSGHSQHRGPGTPGKSHRQRLSGSDGNLHPTYPLLSPHARSRSRLRQIASASSLPSVPEAAAESEHELDSTPLTSDPNMAALVAAVPRRARRGRGRLSEEEERRHSEPVGDKLAMALAQYTADIESGLGRDGLHREDLVSGASLSGTSDHSPARESQTIGSDEQNIPQIHLIEASSSSTDVNSSQESFQASHMSHHDDSVCSVESIQTPRVSTHITDSADNGADLLNEHQSMQIPQHHDEYMQDIKASGKSHEDFSPRVGDKREHVESQRQGESMTVSPKKKKSGVSDEGTHDMDTDSMDSSEEGHGQRSRTSEQTGDSDTRGGESEGNYSADSLEEHEDVDETGDTTPRPHSLSDSCAGAALDMTSAPFCLGQGADQNSDRFELGNSDSDIAASPGISNFETSEDGLDELYFTQDLSGESNQTEVSLTVGDHSTAKGSVPMSHTNSNHQQGQRLGQREAHDGSETSSREGFPQNIQTVSDFSESTTPLASSNPAQTSASTFVHVTPAFAEQAVITCPRSEITTQPHTIPAHGSKQPVADREQIIFRQAPLPLRTESSEPADSGASAAPQVEVTPSSVDVSLSLSNQEMPVSMEMLTLLADGEGSQLSDEASSSHVEKQLQALQEVLQQLSPRAAAAAQVSSSSAPHSANGRRCKRRQHSRQVKGSDSDNADNISDDSLASGGNNSRSSSRPSSGSRRRRRPANKSADVVKKRRGHSSEEYVTSDNDSIYSDDSLTHSSERQEAAASQISSIRASVQQLTADLETVDTEAVQPIEGEGEGAADTMEGERASVPALVTYFESQFPHRRKESDGRERSPGGSQVQHSREASVSSVTSDDGNVSATEGTQTEGSSIVMGKAPVSMWSAGDPNHVPPNEVRDAMCGSQNVQEESSIRTNSRRSWKLSVTPTDLWNSSAGDQDEEMEGQEAGNVQLRRKSQTAAPSPEKRMRQDKLTDLHSKYGLLSEDEQLSDEKEMRKSASARKHADEQDSQAKSEDLVHKKTHIVNKDEQGKLRFEVTINQDETNVLYNVEKTEYKTYTLRDREGTVTEETVSSTVPDTININLTETTTLQREDRFETVTKERVLFNNSSDDLVQVEHRFAGGHMLDYEQEQEEGNVSRESSVERHLTDEDSDSRLKLGSSQSSLADRTSPLGAGSQPASADYSHSKSIESRASASPSKQKATAKVDKQSALAREDAGGTGLPRDAEASDADSRETWLNERRCSDSSSPGPRSSTSWQGGHYSDHTCDSDVPPDSGVTEISTSESVTSHDEDGAEGNMSWGVASPAEPNTSVSPSTTGVPHRVVMHREDISNTFHTSKSGTVATQLQQTIAFHEHGPGPEQVDAMAYQKGGSLTFADDLQQGTSQRPVGTMADECTLTKPAEVILGTPSSVGATQAGTLPGSLETSPESQHSSVLSAESSPLTDGTVHLPVTVKPSDTDALAESQPETAADLSFSIEHTMQRRIEIPVVHLTAEMDSFSERIAQSRDTGSSAPSADSQLEADALHHERAASSSEPETRTDSVYTKLEDTYAPKDSMQDADKAESNMHSVDGSVSECEPQSVPALLEHNMETDALQQIGPGAEAASSEGLHFVPAEMWLDTRQSGGRGRDAPHDRRAEVEAGEWLQVGMAQQSVEQPLAQPTALTRMPPQQRLPATYVSSTDPVKLERQQVAELSEESRTGGLAEGKGYGTNTADLQTSAGPPDSKVTLEQRRKHPSINEVPLERVGQLPSVPVEFGSQSPLMYPYCHDGLLLYTSSQCREEPYTWIESFQEETGIETSASAPEKRRLTSEEIAESMLAEIRRRNEEPWENEEETVFTEEIIITTNWLPPALAVADGRSSREGQAQSATQLIQQDQSTTRLSDKDVNGCRSSTESHTHEVTSAEDVALEFSTETSPAPTQHHSSGFSSTPVPGSVGRETLNHSATPVFDTSSSLQVPGGRLSLASEDSLTASAEESFYSPDTTVQSGSGSSESSVSRTPLQSPREHTAVSVSVTTTSQDAVSNIPSPIYSQTLPAVASSTIHGIGSGVSTVSGEAAGQTSMLTAVAAVVGRPLVGDADEVEAMREALKQEVERKIAHLQRRVRSLSDSAISSDFTEPESTSVSPRSSRFRDADGKVDGYMAEVFPLNYLFPSAVSGDLHEVLVARAEGGAVPSHIVTSADSRAEGNSGGKLEKSLADSGNIHDDDWQDSEQEFLNADSEQSPGGRQQQQHSASGGDVPSQLSYAVNTSRDTVVSKDSKNHAPVHFVDAGTVRSSDGIVVKERSKTSKPVTEQEASACASDSLHHSRPSVVRPHHSEVLRSVELAQLSGRFPERVVNAVLSVPQSTHPLPSARRWHRRRRGMVGRRTKSLGDLPEMLTSQQRSDLEENLREQAQLILKVVAPRHNVDTTTSTGGWADNSGEGTDYGQGDLAVEWVDGHFHPRHGGQASLIPHHPRPATEGISHAWLVSAERAVEGEVQHGMNTDSDTQRTLTVSRMQQIPSTNTETSAGLPSRHDLLPVDKGSVTSVAESITSNGSTFGSSKAPSLSGVSEDWDRASTRTEELRSRDQTQSPEMDSESMLSDDRLLSSGELEVAAINARAAVRGSRPFTDSDTDSRPLSPGEQILADILARQGSTASPTKSIEASEGSNWIRSVRYKPGRGTGSPRRRLPPEHDGSISPGELMLSEETIQRLRDARVELSAHEFQAEAELESEQLTVAQSRMLLRKSFSSSNIGTGHYTYEEDEALAGEDFWQLERPASLACLEGIAVDSSDESDDSGDSICFVFMGQDRDGATAAAGPLGGSCSPSECSEHLVPHSRSTESIPRDVQMGHYVPPLAERSASLDDVHAAASVRVHRREQLHRSRSASLLDVATSMYDDEPDEQIFPPRVYAESETSWDGQTSGPVEDELSSHDAESAPSTARTDASTDMATITNPMFARKSSLLERGHDQQFFKTSPAHQFVDGVLEAREERLQGDAEEIHRLYDGAEQRAELYHAAAKGIVPPSPAEGVSEVESGRPYFKYHSPGTRPQQSENGSQTEAERRPVESEHGRRSVVIHTESNRQQAQNGSSLKRSQSTGSLEALQLAQATAEASPREEAQVRLPLSPGSERWMELSHLMLETTQILRSLQHTLPARNRSSSLHSSAGSLTSPKGCSSGTQTAREISESAWTQTDVQSPERARSASMGTQSSPPPDTTSLLSQRLETGTQTPTFTSGFTSPVTVGGYPGYAFAPEPQRIVIKVKDALTQTSASLGDLSSIEVQTDEGLEELHAGAQMFVRPDMRDASSSVESMLVADTTCQTDDVSSDSADLKEVRHMPHVGADVNVTDTMCQTDDSMDEKLSPVDMLGHAGRAERKPVADSIWQTNQVSVDTCEVRDRKQTQQFADTDCQTDEVALSETMSQQVRGPTRSTSTLSQTEEQPADRKSLQEMKASISWKSGAGGSLMYTSSCQTDSFLEDRSELQGTSEENEDILKSAVESHIGPLDILHQTSEDTSSLAENSQQLGKVSTVIYSSSETQTSVLPSPVYHSDVSTYADGEAGKLDTSSKEPHQMVDMQPDSTGEPGAARPQYKLVSVSTQMSFDLDRRLITVQDHLFDGKADDQSCSTSSLERGSPRESVESGSSEEDRAASVLGTEQVPSFRGPAATGETADSWTADQALAASIATLRQNRDIIQMETEISQRDRRQPSQFDPSVQAFPVGKSFPTGRQFADVAVQSREPAHPADFVQPGRPPTQDAVSETEPWLEEEEFKAGRLLEDSGFISQADNKVERAEAVGPGAVYRAPSVSVSTQYADDSATRLIQVQDTVVSTSLAAGAQTADMRGQLLDVEEPGSVGIVTTLLLEAADLDETPSRQCLTSGESRSQSDESDTHHIAGLNVDDAKVGVYPDSSVTHDLVDAHQPVTQSGDISETDFAHTDSEQTSVVTPAQTVNIRQLGTDEQYNLYTAAAQRDVSDTDFIQDLPTGEMSVTLSQDTASVHERSSIANRGVSQSPLISSQQSPVDEFGKHSAPHTTPAEALEQPSTGPSRVGADTENSMLPGYDKDRNQREYGRDLSISQEERVAESEERKHRRHEDGDRLGELSYRREEILEDSPEVIRRERPMSVERGPTVSISSQSLQDYHAGASASPREHRDAAELPHDEVRRKDRQTGWQPDWSGGELSYKWEESFEPSTRSSMRLSAPAQWSEEEDMLDDSQEELFSSDARQRAAWRARAGDYDLGTSPVEFGHTHFGMRPGAFVDLPQPQPLTIMNEIEKLRQEHARMMHLLERSRNRSPLLLSAAHRTRSASPRMTHAGSGSSSSGGSPITVVAGRGSVSGSPVTVTTAYSTRSAHAGTSGASTEGGANLYRRTLIGDTLARSRSYSPSSSQRNGVQPASPRSDRGIDSPRNIVSLQSPRQLSSDPTQNDLRKRQDEFGADRDAPDTTDNSADNMRKMQDQLEVSRPPLDTRDVSATTSSLPLYSAAGDWEQATRQRRPNGYDAVELMTPASTQLSTDLSSFHDPMDDVLSDSPPTTSASPVTVVDVTEVCTTPASLVDTPRSIGGASTPGVLVDTLRSLGGDNVPSVNHLLPVSPGRVSTGVEAAVDSSDDFTQTDVEDYDEGSLHLSQLDASGASFASGDSKTRRIRAELDRLHRERVEIIELLSLQYLPASLTVELLEAKLNYCIGQTDMLLASLETSWAREESDPSKSRLSVDEEYLIRYRQQFEQSRKDLKVCMEEARRLQNGTRGRRMARTRDIIALKRRAEIEAFKLERHREQVLFDRKRNFSPASSTDHHPDSLSESGLEPHQMFDPRFMTPKQHKEHLVKLRRSLVAASTEELNELRHRSASSGSYSPSPDRSMSPASSYSNLYQFRDSSLGPSLSPERLPAAFRVAHHAGSATHSTPLKIPRLVVPHSDPSHSRAYSLPRGHHPHAPSRSSSWGPTNPTRRDGSYLVPPLEGVGYTQFSQSSALPEDLDPEQLLAESYAARQLNQQQISKAQQALRLLEEHRSGLRSQLSQDRSGSKVSSLRLSAGADAQQDQAIEREIATLQQQHSQSPRSSTNNDLDSGVMSLTFQESMGSNVPPESTSTPRSNNSFAAYARDILARNERHIQTIVARSNTSDEQASQDTSYDLSLSGTPSSLQSTDLDSFLNTTSSSTQQSYPRFTTSRPISSQDIKARIARRLLERSKTKK